MPPTASTESSSRKWLARLGYGLVLAGLLFFTPLTDLLPIETLSFLQTAPPHTYFKVVPVRGDAFVIQPAFARAGVCLVLCGIAIVAGARVGSRTYKP